jgi:hypothetical protein
MKKSFSIILVVLLLLNTFGFDVYFGFVIQQCKYEAEQIGGENEGLTEMILSRAEESSLIFTGKDEFKMNGRLYDIVRKEYEDGKVRIYCYDDENEDKAVDAYNSFSREEGNPVTSRNAGFVLNNLIRNYITPAVLLHPEPVKAAEYVELSERSYKTISPNIALPPPKPFS